MSKRRPGTRFVRALMALAVGGSALQLSGCDANVRAALLQGLQQTTQSLSTALISAFFLSLQDDSALAGGLTTT